MQSSFVVRRDGDSPPPPAEIPFFSPLREMGVINPTEIRESNLE